MGIRMKKLSYSETVQIIDPDGGFSEELNKMGCWIIAGIFIWAMLIIGVVAFVMWTSHPEMF